jgi:exosortase A
LADVKRDVVFSVEHVASAGTLSRAAALAVALAVVAVVAIYYETAASIVAIWMRSETFAHGFVVIPLSLWLAWRKRHELAVAPVRPWWPGLFVVAAAGALGVVGAAAGAAVVRQFALAFTVQGALVTVLGLQAARVLAFPIAFLLFAVPAGEFLVPMLIDRTADFTIAALRLSGIPVYREGNRFAIPSGTWSVVEACSGIRYIIASLMVGTIYAAIAYRSARRRAIFLAASLVVPVVANWLRAYIIVMLGHLSGNRIAVGVDHLIYGWVFFGIVMALLFWVGSFWQESGPGPSTGGASRAEVSSAQTGPAHGFMLAALGTVLAAAVWQPLAAALERPASGALPTLPPIVAADGWEPTTSSLAWRPDYGGYATQLEQSFAKDGQEVSVLITYYRGQSKGRELITSLNALVMPENRDWKIVASDADSVTWSGSQATVHRGVIVGNGERYAELDMFWVGGRVTGSAYVGKALQAWSKLTGNGDDAALIVLAAPARELKQRDSAGEALRSFAAAMSPAIEHSLDAARRSGR